jgi:hypothetical protein
MEGEHWLMRSGVKSALTATSGNTETETETETETNTETKTVGRTSLLSD